MKIISRTKLDLIQGSEEWKQKRMSCITATDIAVIMGVSKFSSRTELLDEKCGVKKEISPFLQKKFDEGHATEEAARLILEAREAEEFPPEVWEMEVEGFDMPFLASLDGTNGDVNFEHKLWNQNLVDQLNANQLPEMYSLQMHWQMLVKEAEATIFVVSDGTEENFVDVCFFYKESRNEEILPAVKVFIEDLRNHKVKEKAEKIEVETTFPVIQCSSKNGIITSNLAQVLPLFKSMAKVEMSRVLVTDIDFAEKEAINKAIKDGRASLKTKMETLQSDFLELDQVMSLAKEIDSVLQKMQSAGEKQVKEEKEKRKFDLVNKYSNELSAHVSEKIKQCGNLIPLIAVNADFDGAMKGKRNFESMENAVTEELAKAKAEVNAQMDKVIPNIAFIREFGADFMFLFERDISERLTIEVEAFQAIVKERINTYKEQEAEKLKRIEEQAQIRAEAKAKADTEALAENEREKIRNEEREKIRNEAPIVMRAPAQEEQKIQTAIATVEDWGVIQRPVEEVDLIARPPVDYDTESKQMVEVSRPVYDKLVLDAEKFKALEAQGVEGWEGYAKAMARLF